MGGRHRRKRNIWLAQKQRSKANSNSTAVLDRNTKEDKLQELPSKFSVDELVVLANRTSDHQIMKRSIDFENAGWHLGEDGLYEDKDGLDLGQKCKSDCCYRVTCCTCCTTECHPPCKGKNCKTNAPCPGGPCGPTEKSVPPLTSPDAITCPPMGWFIACHGDNLMLRMCQQIVNYVTNNFQKRQKLCFNGLTTPVVPKSDEKVIKRKCHNRAQCVKKQEQDYKKRLIHRNLMERTGLVSTRNPRGKYLKIAGIACAVILLIMLAVLFYCYCVDDPVGKKRKGKTGKTGSKKGSVKGSKKGGKSSKSKKSVKKSSKSKKSKKMLKSKLSSNKSKKK